jgi:4-hydroxy-3-methylbut-2-en-1-yl diphosphate synthase IspG/GcpE
MKMNLGALTLAALLVGGTVRAETFQNLEAVDTNGFSTWAGSYPLTVMGVILNDPGEMLDATPNFIPWNNGARAYPRMARS